MYLDAHSFRLVKFNTILTYNFKILYSVRENHLCRGDLLNVDFLEMIRLHVIFENILLLFLIIISIYCYSNRNLLFNGWFMPREIATKKINKKITTNRHKIIDPSTFEAQNIIIGRLVIIIRARNHWTTFNQETKIPDKLAHLGYCLHV